MKRQRKRNIIWYNPPFDQNVKTNIGSEFLKIVNKCFPPRNKLHKIFNRHTVKVSYSCMPSVERIVDGNNKRVLREARNSDTNSKKCNCLKPASCPLQGECQSSDIVYQATVECNDNKETYVGLAATTFKLRLANHKSSFKCQSKRNATELSKHIWRLKDNNLTYSIKWKILCRAPHYSNKTRKCSLCIAEKFYILCKPGFATLNKRNELLGSCRHKNNFLLRNVK